MDVTKEMLINEIKTLQKAAQLHATYSISQYKKVLKALYRLEEEKELLAEKVQNRTKHLISEIKQKESLANKLDKIAKYDQLTGLANRYLFFNELEILKKESDLMDKTFALLFIDLDGFKAVNDTYGHEIGDILLQTVAHRLKQNIRKNDLVARLGGDEFTIILKDISQNKIKEIASKIISDIKQTININNLKIYVGSSIGIYVYNKSDNINDIITKADIAMYEAKKKGKGQYVFFDDRMQKELHKHSIIKKRIYKALNNKEFINYFQPIISNTTYNIIGAETLLRWKPEDELIPPNEFIPLLEEDINLIKSVTLWQIKEIVKLLLQTNIYFTINISVKILNEELLEFLTKILNKYKFDPKRLHLEVTESTLSTNFKKSSQILNAINNLGFELSLDDFGTGYSSLAYLRDFPFDILKIDKKFIDNISSVKDIKLLKAIIDMAEILDMKIVVEGIETESQLNLVNQNDENIKYQGFYFYKPMEFKDLKKLLNYKS